MDAQLGIQFWFAIGISFVFGIIASLIATVFGIIYQDRLLRWLDSRSNLSRLRSLARKKLVYALVLKLRADPHYATQFHGTRIVRIVVAATMGLLSLMLVLAPTLPDALALTIQLIVVPWAAVAFLGLRTLVDKYVMTLRKLGDLEAYRDALRKRWPDEKWE